jgi:hypothetical protein
VLAHAPGATVGSCLSTTGIQLGLTALGLGSVSGGAGSVHSALWIATPPGVVMVDSKQLSQSGPQGPEVCDGLGGALAGTDFAAAEPSVTRASTNASAGNTHGRP